MLNFFRRISFIVGIVTLALPLQARAAPAHPTTWSIVALDAATGDVGVAGASCFPGNIDAIAALAPGKGAAVAQAQMSIDNRNRVFAWLKDGQPAEKILAHVTDASFDPLAGARQYGIVTLSGGNIQAAGFTGKNNFSYAGDQQDAARAVSVQGNLLEGEAVVRDALSAFQDAARAGAAMPDRLMRALEAGSAAGGDARCNNAQTRQTANSAFILFARGADAPYAAPNIGATDAGKANAPYLALSVREETYGKNPLIELRARYDAWKKSNAPAASPTATSSAPARGATPLQIPLPFALAGMFVSGLAFVIFMKRMRR